MKTKKNKNAKKLLIKKKLKNSKCKQKKLNKLGGVVLGSRPDEQYFKFTPDQVELRKTENGDLISWYYRKNNGNSYMIKSIPWANGIFDNYTYIWVKGENVWECKIPEDCDEILKKPTKYEIEKQLKLPIKSHELKRAARNEH